MSVSKNIFFAIRDQQESTYKNYGSSSGYTNNDIEIKVCVLLGGFKIIIRKTHEHFKFGHGVFRVNFILEKIFFAKIL